MRGIPRLTVVDPRDALKTEQAVLAMAAHNDRVYMRLLRGKVPLAPDEYDYKFKLGQAKLLRNGTDVLIVPPGILTMRALEAAQELDDGSASVDVLHVPTIKRLDEASSSGNAKPGRLVIFAENHSCVGGLGEAVAQP
jgi:transketolase